MLVYNEDEIVFAGNKYNYGKLVGLVPTMPKISVDVSDLGEVQKDGIVIDEDVVLFFKREGKMIVIVGQSVVLKQINDGVKAVTGYLVSSVVLKKARIQEETPAETAETTGFYSMQNRWDGNRNNRNSKTRK